MEKINLTPIKLNESESVILDVLSGSDDLNSYNPDISCTGVEELHANQGV